MIGWGGRRLLLKGKVLVLLFWFFGLSLLWIFWPFLAVLVVY
jgi:hypothetical protein